MFCTNCGNQVAENAVACMSCGMRPQGSKKFCGKCGKPVNEQQVVCTSCGCGLGGAASPPPVHAAVAQGIFCTNCGKPVSENAIACMSCGAQPTGHKSFCRNCGSGVTPQQVVCIKCGSGLGTISAPKKPITASASATASASGGKNRTTAAILALVLGGVGGHRFYLGSWGWGLLNCIPYIGWLPGGILGLIDGIKYLKMTDEEFAAKYPVETQSAFRW